MAQRTNLTGQYVRVNETYLRRRAEQKDDARHVFYKAMLLHNTYEAYEAATDGITVTALSYGAGNEKITGRDEILYNRRNKRIVDAGR